MLTDKPDMSFPKVRHPYHGCRAVLVTMHGKEQAVRKPFQDVLNITVNASNGIDTDLFGTFTGERPRSGTMLETALAKARLGIMQTGCRFSLASEGSYGPDPIIPYMACAHEVMVFIDAEKNIVITEQLKNLETNYASATFSCDQDPRAFLERIGFPSHGVIVRANPPSSLLFKGITDYETLKQAIHSLKQEQHQSGFTLSTDMRAQFNPTRMALIAQLASQLAVRINSICKACGTAGFGQVGAEQGLKCEDCGSPTQQIKSRIFGCVHCDHREYRPRSDGRGAARAADCSFCNP